LVADYTLCISVDSISDHRVGGQAAEGAATGVHERHEVAAIVAVGVVLVVVGVGGSRAYGDDERAMKLLCVRGR
jgi:hypothetical protein